MRRCLGENQIAGLYTGNTGVLQRPIQTRVVNRPQESYPTNLSSTESASVSIFPKTGKVAEDLIRVKGNIGKVLTLLQRITDPQTFETGEERPTFVLFKSRKELGIDAPYRNQNRATSQKPNTAARLSNTERTSAAFAYFGCSPNEGEDRLNTIYRKIVFLYNPDKNPGNKTAEAKFLELQSNYEVAKKYFAKLRGF